MLRKHFRQTHDIGIGSLPIIAIISTFIGAVTAVQFAKQFLDMTLPLPMSLIGYIVRDSLILELVPTIGSLMLAGKVGSNISSELGSMRVTEQIDALEIMGVNTKAYLIMPKFRRFAYCAIAFCLCGYIRYGRWIFSGIFWRFFFLGRNIKQAFKIRLPHTTQ